jgi:hypothetical protein
MIEKFLNNKQQALLALAVTAMPGLQRALLVLLIQFRYGLVSLGQFTNDLSVVFILTHFTAIGWASLILVRVPAAEGIERLSVIHRLLRFVFLILGIGMLFITGLGFFGVVFQPLFMMCLLVGWTGYQLIRHSFIALRDYRILLRIDLLCTGCMAALVLWPGNRVDPLLAIGMPLLALSAAGLLYLMYRSREMRAWADGNSGKDFRSGMEFGMANFLSDGMILLLAPLASLLAGPAYAGLIGLILSGMGILLLFPRALTMHHISALARAKKADPSEFLTVFLSFRRILLGLLLLIAVALLPIAAVGGPLFFPDAISLENSWMIFVLLLANTVIGQMAVPDSSRLMVNEQGHLMMRINGAAFAIFGALILVLCLMPSDAAELVLLLGGQVAISGIRCLWLNLHARRMRYGDWAQSAA